MLHRNMIGHNVSRDNNNGDFPWKELQFDLFDMLFTKFVQQLIKKRSKEDFNSEKYPIDSIN